MRKQKILATGLAVLLLAVALASGCANRKLTSTADGFVDQSGAVYQPAPACYIPAVLGNKCGTLDGSQKFGMDLYTIENMDDQLWLAAEDGTVFYADGIALPTLAEMEPIAVYIYTHTEVPSKHAEITDAKLVADLTAACAPEKADTFPPAAVPTAQYTVRFKSDKYPGLYYTLRYVVYENGYYLYDPTTKARYTIGREIYDALYTTPDTDTNGE